MLLQDNSQILVNSYKCNEIQLLFPNYNATSYTKTEKMQMYYGIQTFFSYK